MSGSVHEFIPEKEVICVKRKLISKDFDYGNGPMSQLLVDRTAVVTGAASGIGRAIATKFAQEGADVVVADVRDTPRIDEEPTQEYIDEHTESSAKYVHTDVTDISDLEAAIAAADEFGGLDVMVNNAGILGPLGPVTEVDYEEYRELMSVNLDGVFFGSQIAAEKFLDQGDGGVIVNMSSLAALLGYTDIVPYSTAKAGVMNMTYALADELGEHGIRVNAIHPGEVETAMIKQDFPVIGTGEGEAIKQMIPLEKFAQPEDIANAATFLASDMASHITAESLVVDGGYHNTP